MFSHVVEQRALAETHHHRVEEALALVVGEALEVRSQANRLQAFPTAVTHADRKRERALVRGPPGRCSLPT
jgi:hypothetical protein